VWVSMIEVSIGHVTKRSEGARAHVSDLTCWSLIVSSQGHIWDPEGPPVVHLRYNIQGAPANDFSYWQDTSPQVWFLDGLAEYTIGGMVGGTEVTCVHGTRIVSSYVTRRGLTS